MEDFTESFLNYGYPLPKDLIEINSFSKLRQLAAFWFIPKSRLLNVEVTAEEWTEEIERIPDNFRRLPLGEEHFKKGGIIKTFDQLLELESINPLLTYFLIDTYENIRALEVKFKTPDGDKIVSPWNSLEVLSHFKSCEIPTLIYRFNGPLVRAIDDYCEKINSGDELLHYGPNVALLFCHALIKKGKFHSLVSSIFPQDISRDQFCAMDNKFGPILFHPMISHEHKAEMANISDYLSTLTVINQTIDSVNPLNTYQDLVKAMQCFGPLARLLICRQSTSLALITNEDELNIILALMQLPKSLFKHFTASLPEPFLLQYDQCITQAEFITSCYGYSNSQLLDAGLYAWHGSGLQTGQGEYLTLLNWRVKAGLIPDISEAVNILRKLHMAKQSARVGVDPTLMQNLEESLLLYLIDKANCIRRPESLPDCIVNLVQFKSYENNQKLYDNLKSMVNKNLSLTQRCLQVLCIAKNAHCFFAYSDEDKASQLPINLLQQGQDILNDMKAASIITLPSKH